MLGIGKFIVEIMMIDMMELQGKLQWKFFDGGPEILTSPYLHYFSQIFLNIENFDWSSSDIQNLTEQSAVSPHHFIPTLRGYLISIAEELFIIS